MPIYEKATSDDGGIEFRAAANRSMANARAAFKLASGCEACGSPDKAVVTSTSDILIVECQRCADKRS
jgi:hypothetical protein